MRTRWSVITACVLTAVSAGVFFLRQATQAAGPENAALRTWRVAMTADGDLAPTSAAVVTAVPLDFRRQHIFDEQFRSPMLSAPTGRKSADRGDVKWRRATVGTSESFSLEYGFLCQTDVPKPSAAMNRLTRKLDGPPPSGLYIGPEPRIESDHAEVAAKAKALSEGYTEAADQVAAFFGDVAALPDELPRSRGSALRCLRQGAGDDGAKARLLVALCRNRNIPARVVTGLMLEETRDLGLHHGAEAWVGDHWLPMCPTRGYFGTRHFPTNFLVLKLGDEEVVRGHHVKAKVTFAVELIDDTGSAHATALQRLWRAVSFTALPPSARHLTRFLLLLPVAALIVSIFRTLVGVPTFGTFSPRCSAWFRRSALVAVGPGHPARHHRRGLGAATPAGSLSPAPRAADLRVAHPHRRLSARGGDGGQQPWRGGVAVRGALSAGDFDAPGRALLHDRIRRWHGRIPHDTGGNAGGGADDQPGAQPGRGRPLAASLPRNPGRGAGGAIPHRQVHWIPNLRTDPLSRPAGGETAFRRCRMNWLSRYFELARRGILGMNRRNAECILDHNPRSRFPLVDGKKNLAELCERLGVPTPEVFGVVASHSALRRLPEILADREAFVVKPNRGAAGRGILVITGRDGDRLVRHNGLRIRDTDVRQHVADIVSGLYSLGGQDDAALIQRRVLPHPALECISYQGTADIRLILYRHVPAMAMLRLPTRRSGGRANLHQGAIGAGIDLDTGETCHAVIGNRSARRNISRAAAGRMQVVKLDQTRAGVAGIEAPQHNGVVAWIQSRQNGRLPTVRRIEVVAGDGAGPRIVNPVVTRRDRAVARVQLDDRVF